MDVEEQQVRELYGLKSSEPNILFALCCGIRSSPAVSTSRLIIVVAAAVKLPGQVSSRAALNLHNIVKLSSQVP